MEDANELIKQRVGVMRPIRDNSITLSFFENRYNNFTDLGEWHARLAIPENVTVEAYSHFGKLPAENFLIELAKPLFAFEGPCSVVVSFSGLEDFEDFAENKISCLVILEESGINGKVSQTAETLHWKDLGDGFDGELDCFETVFTSQESFPSTKLLELEETIPILNIYRTSSDQGKLGWQLWLRAERTR